MPEIHVRAHVIAHARAARVVRDTRPGRAVRGTAGASEHAWRIASSGVPGGQSCAYVRIAREAPKGDASRPPRAARPWRRCSGDAQARRRRAPRAIARARVARNGARDIASRSRCAHGSSAPPTTCSGNRHARSAIGDVHRVLRAISSRLRTSQLHSLARPVTGSNGSARFLPTEIGIFRAVAITLCVTPQGGTGCLLPKLRPPHHPLAS